MNTSANVVKTLFPPNKSLLIKLFTLTFLDYYMMTTIVIIIIFFIIITFIQYLFDYRLQCV